MSALGQKRTIRSAIVMSALPPKADMRSAKWAKNGKALDEWFRLESGAAQTTVFMRATHVAMTSSTGIAHQRLEKISTST